MAFHLIAHRRDNGKTRREGMSDDVVGDVVNGVVGESWKKLRAMAVNGHPAGAEPVMDVLSYLAMELSRAKAQLVDLKKRVAALEELQLTPYGNSCANCLHDLTGECCKPLGSQGLCDKWEEQ